MSTVKDLIEFLQMQPQDLQVAIDMYSETCLLDFTEIKREIHSVARADGWIHFKRADKPTQEYLVFPGN